MIIARTRLKELFPANQSPALPEVPAEVSGLGEGGEDGRLEAGKSVTFAILEVSDPVIMTCHVTHDALQVVVCVLVRHFPDISPRAAQSSSVIAMQARSRARSRTGSGLSPDQESLVSTTLGILGQLPSLCSPQGK